MRSTTLVLLTATILYAQDGRKPLPIEQIRQMIPAGVKFLPDVAYREGSAAWRMDIAMPEAQWKDPRPALLIVHGGGWGGGDKRLRQFTGLMLDYAAHGYVAASVNYRLTAEAALPAAIADVKNAVRYWRAHAKEYGLDPNRIGVYGNSAGAHLAAMLALAGKDADLEGDGPYQNYSSAVQAVCTSGTPTDLMKGRLGTPPRSLALFGGPEGLAEKARRSSPVTYARKSIPPYLMIQGSADATIPPDDSRELFQALRAAGAKDVTLMMIQDAGHNVFVAHAPETEAAMRAFFERTLRKPGS
jgi:acetyl esterase/lipase